MKLGGKARVDVCVWGGGMVVQTPVVESGLEALMSG